MINLTIAMDDRTLERARSKASQQGTSLDALVRSYVETYAGGEESREQAVKGLLALSEDRGWKRWPLVDARRAP